MRAGPLRTQATVKRPTTTTSARGVDVTVWARQCVVSIDLRSLAGRERPGVMQVVADASWRAFTHYTPYTDIRVKDRLEVGSQTFDVLAVINVDNRNRMLQIELAETKESA